MGMCQRRDPFLSALVSLIKSSYTVNLTADGTCTDVEQRVSSLPGSPCVAVSNATLGTIINPVRSARLTTAGRKSITYGRVEVVAKLPAGDWLWPAIWYVLSELIRFRRSATYLYVQDDAPGLSLRPMAHERRNRYL
jgi:hypothetical protein